jgi:hypothetical protein
VITAPNVVVRGLAINLFRFSGIRTFDGAEGARIEGNFIGTDATGTLDRGNAFSGLEIVNGGGHTIGGTTPGRRNIISGNDDEGIVLGGEGGNKVQGNLIGVQKDGTSPRGNAEEAIGIDASGNTIGGTQPGAANTIAFNADVGVLVNGSINTGNRILGNSMFANGELGIDLGNNGDTANDPLDRDTGPNNLQNKPVLTFAKVDDGTTMEGRLESAPSTKRKKKTFTIQFFSNPQDEDEGKTFLGQKTVQTNRRGKVSFTFHSRLSAGNNVTATATDSRGDTSEFSAPQGVARI